MLAAFHLNLTALSSIALLVGLFLVYNAVSVSVLARRQEIGTLRALGVSRAARCRPCSSARPASSAWLGVALGIPLARLLADVTVSLTSQHRQHAVRRGGRRTADADLGRPAARRAGRDSAVAARRVAAGPRSGRRPADGRAARRRPGRWPAPRVSRARGSLAAVLLALAAGLSQLPPIAGLARWPAIWPALHSSSARRCSCRWLLQVAAQHGRPVWYRLFGVGGWLAHAALGGAIGRVAVSVAALAVSLAMMVAITVMVGSFRQTVIDWVGQSLKADLFVGPASRRSGARAPTISRAVEDVVRAHPEVAAVDAFRSVTVPYENSLIYMGAGDFALQERFGGLALHGGRAETAAGTAGRLGAATGPLESRATTHDAVIVSEPFANRYRKRAGRSAHARDADRARVAFEVRRHLRRLLERSRRGDDGQRHDDAPLRRAAADGPDGVPEATARARRRSAASCSTGSMAPPASSSSPTDRCARRSCASSTARSRSPTHCRPSRSSSRFWASSAR